MDKPLKIMLGISVLLFILFLVIIFNDYVQFQKNLVFIADSLESSDPSKLQASWFAVVVIRAVEFLIPSFLLGAGALIMYIRDNRKPKKKGS